VSCRYCEDFPVPHPHAQSDRPEWSRSLVTAALVRGGSAQLLAPSVVSFLKAAVIVAR
jgi:hypothetical protein